MQPNTTQRLSDEQVERLVLVIKNLKEFNATAAVAWAALEKEADLEGKRKVLVMTFAHTYELMLCMNMAVNSNKKPAAFESDLQDIRRQQNARTN